MVAHLVRIRTGKSRRSRRPPDGARPESRVPIQFAGEDIALPGNARTARPGRGDPLRMLYAFDQRRTAILLVAGDKTGGDRWYETNVPVADQLFERHLRTIEKERTEHG